jgi:hypothetical protein
MAKVYDGLHHEMARADMKIGKLGGRNPFSILGDLMEAGKWDRLTGEINRDFVLWREYEKAINRRPLLTWSQGLKDRLGVVGKSDEELAEEEVGGDHVAELPPWAWATIRYRPPLMAEILAKVERFGGEAVRELLAGLPGPRARAA